MTGTALLGAAFVPVAVSTFYPDQKEPEENKPEKKIYPYSYYFTQQQWAATEGWGKVPEDRDLKRLAPDEVLRAYALESELKECFKPAL